MRPNGVKVLPNNFTLEYDLITDENVTEHESGILNIFVKAEGLSLEDYSYHFSDTPQIKLDIKPYSQNLVVSAFRESGFTGGIEETSCIFQETRANFWTPSKVHRVSISRIGTRLVAYVNQTKVFDIANALPPNVGYTLLMATDLWETGFYVSNLRLATDAKLPATELKERQTYFTENILFGTDSDRINPRSYQTIRRIAQALKEVDGKIKIIGHTDNTGKAEYNMELSKKRAESVKRTLVREFGIEASRIETEGKGQTEPIGSNDTVQGRAANRRVEFRIVK
jgi:outer membrane protein OmpA-like peptidoglycan-associated protein